MPSWLNGLPAPKGLAVESESYGLALRSPRYSAEAERGHRTRKRSRSGIGYSCDMIGLAVGYFPGEYSARDQ